MNEECKGAVVPLKYEDRWVMRKLKKMVSLSSFREKKMDVCLKKKLDKRNVFAVVE